MKPLVGGLLLVLLLSCSESYYPVPVEGGFSLLSQEGELLGEGVYQQIHPYSSTLYRVMHQGEWYLLDPQAGLKEEGVDYIGVLSDKRALFIKNGQYGYLDPEGKEVISPEYTYGHPFSEGLASVRTEENLLGYINKKGEWVIPPQFHKGESFNQGAALVEKEGSLMLINTKGETIWPKNE